MECGFLEKKINILTENVDGEIYLLSADNYNELVNDWLGDCNYVPANDAKVYFASYCGRPISPYVYTDFLSLAQYIQNECCFKHEWERTWQPKFAPSQSQEVVNGNSSALSDEELCFIDDKEKMVDFVSLSKEEFLASYSYLSEEEYDATNRVFELKNDVSLEDKITEATHRSLETVAVETAKENIAKE